MDDPGTLATVGRIAVAVFVMIAPSLLFLGLLRGLERLRDDAFIDQWLYEQGYEPADNVLSVLGSGLELESAGSSGVRCSACGTTNASHAAYCHDCLRRLPS